MYELLTLIAFILLAVFIPIGIAVGTVVGIAKGKREVYYKNVSGAADVFGNVVCSELFNIALIKSNGFKFGNPLLTVSETLAQNKKQCTLTLFGKILSLILIKLKDPSFTKPKQP